MKTFPPIQCRSRDLEVDGDIFSQLFHLHLSLRPLALALHLYSLSTAIVRAMLNSLLYALADLYLLKAARTQNVRTIHSRSLSFAQTSKD